MKKKITFIAVFVLLAFCLMQAQSPLFRIRLWDTNLSHYLQLMWNEDRAANQTLNFITGAGDRTFTLSGDLTVESASLINQDVTTDASPTWVTAKFSGLTDGYVPYHVADATGLANSPLQISGTSVGIGAVPSQAFDVIGAVEIQDTTTSTTGVILKGADRFIHNFHHPTGNTAIPAGKNTFVGVNAGNFTMGSTATETSHGSFNTGIGVEALAANSFGTRNTAVGYRALFVNTTGAYNTAMGREVLSANVSSAGNTGIGSAALLATTGAYNIAIGYASMFTNTSGSYNIAIGHSAGSYQNDGTSILQTPENSIYIGSLAKSGSDPAGGEDDITNELVIGYNAVGLGANSSVIGNSNTTIAKIWGNTTVAGGIVETGGVLKEQLLTNSGFGVWSQSDTNKGISRACAVDSGSTSPTVGETVTGATSGAVGKVMMMSDSAGDWGANTGTGNLYLGACLGRFQDNEDLDGSTSGANFCTVNMPDNAAGVDLVQNGDFSVDTDPPPGWTSVDLAVLTTEAGGQIGNCIMITGGAGANPHARQTIPATAGKVYTFSTYVKEGTESTYALWIYDVENAAIIWALEAEAGAAWAQIIHTFEAPVGCSNVYIGLFQICAPAAGTTIYYDEISLYEITPGCTAAGSVLAMDGWTKSSGTDIYRQHNDGGTLTKDGSFYALKFVPTDAAHQIYWGNVTTISLAETIQKYAGRTVTFGAWIKTSTASHCRLRIDDGASTNSSYHTGGGAWEWLELTDAISAAASTFYPTIRAEAADDIDGSTIIYISQPMLVFGSAIGEGNYRGIPQEVIYFEKKINSNTYDTTTGWSDLAWTDLNLEADSSAVIPKGIKALIIHGEALDTGSGAAVSLHIHLRGDATMGEHYALCWAGIANSASAHTSGTQPCDYSGDVDIEIDASGAGTLDILEFHFHGVILR